MCTWFTINLELLSIWNSHILFKVGTQHLMMWPNGMVKILIGAKTISLFFMITFKFSLALQILLQIPSQNKQQILAYS